MPQTEPPVTEPAPPRRVRADAARNRQHLLAAADDAFAEQGTEASLEDIARRAAVGIGTLYRHFPTRDDLVAAVIDDGVDDLVALADDLVAAPDGRGALRTWLVALIAHIARYRGLASSLVAARCGDGRLTESCHRQEAAAVAVVERAKEAGELRDDVPVADVLDLVSALGWLAEGGRDADPVHLLDVVLAGLAPQR